MATNEIKLKISSNVRNIPLDLHNGSPYYVGARAYVEQTEGGAVLTVIDKDGTTIAVINNGTDGATGANGNGIVSITKTDTTDLVDTYTITFDNGVTTTFEVTNGADGNDGADGDDGVGITSITKTGTVGLVDTYTITYTDGTFSTFDVTNGRDGEDGSGVQSDWDELDPTADAYIKNKPTIPTKVSDLTNDSGFITSGDIPAIPTKTSDLTNDSGFIATETDPTVPSWAKQADKPSYTFSEIYQKPNSLSGYGIADAYTKSEIDALVSAVLNYKGTKATVSLLPTSGNITGDVWHITSDGSEWAWDGSQWQELGTSVDLSGYVPTSRKINGNSLTSDVTLNIPTKTSDLTNDSGFITSASLPTEVYWATYGTTTYSELRTEYMANKLIVLKSYQIALSKYDGSVFTFVGFDSQTRVTQATLDSGDTWNMSWYTVPSKTSDLTNDSGFIASETDPTVPAWAKASTKPTYTAIEVGALPSTTSIPSKTSDLTNDSGYITSSDIPQEVFWATYGATTSAEIDTAYQAGKVVCAKKGNAVYTLVVRLSATSHTFVAAVDTDLLKLTCTNNVWSTSTTCLVPLDSNDKIIDYYLPDYHDIFWATYGTTTNAEIMSALNAGKVPVVAVSDRLLTFRYGASTFQRFVCVDNGSEYSAVCNNDTWSTSTQTFVPVNSNGKIDASYLPVYNGGVS